MARFNYKYEKYDFKRFLEDSNPDRFRSEKHMFWVGTIPLPDEIVFQMFDDRGKLIGFYLNHLFALLGLLEIESESSFDESVVALYPDKTNPLNISFNELKKKLLNKKSSYGEIVKKLCELLQLDSYTYDFTFIEEALLHKGKKYNRMYIHPEVRKFLEGELDWFDYGSFRAQSDMFGNVLADHYKIYRGGISDALSGIFNKLIDFLILGAQHNVSERVSVNNSNISIEVAKKENEIDSAFFEERSLMDGSIWEPAYIGEQLGFYIDPSHPYSEKVLNSNDEGAFMLLRMLSNLEFNTFNEKERQKYQSIRKELSRKLKSEL